MIDWANLTGLQTLILAIVGLLDAVGIIALCGVFIYFRENHRIDNPNDYYIDCDMEKVEDNWGKW